MNAELQAPKVQPPQKIQLTSIVFDSDVISRAPGHPQLYLLFNEKEACLEIKGLNEKNPVSFSDQKKVAFARIRSIRDILDREVRIGFEDGVEMGFGMKDGKDAEVSTSETGAAWWCCYLHGALLLALGWEGG